MKILDIVAYIITILGFMFVFTMLVITVSVEAALLWIIICLLIIITMCCLFSITKK